MATSTNRRHRIAIGGILFEGNSLSPVRTTLAAFRSKYLKADGEIARDLANSGTEMAGALSVLEACDCEIVPLIATHGGAGGKVTAECWRELKDMLVGRLRGRWPVDGIYLALHGAMICEGTDDAEGDLLEEIRGFAGDVPIAVSCDLHGNITPKMIRHADILIGYQLYPHDDGPETGQRATGLLIRTIEGAIRPTMSLCKAPALYQSQRQRTKGDTPMARFYRVARAREAAGRALALSYFPVQPWLDVPELGFAAVAVTDGDPAAADDLARTMAAEGWTHRDEFRVGLTAPADAIRSGLALAGHPVILVDAADCVGGGASGDSAIVLAQLMRHAPEASAAVLIVDPETVAQAAAAGAGATISVGLGNKLDPAYGTPLRCSAKVLRLFDGNFRYGGGVMRGDTASMGPSAVLQIGAATVLVASLSSYEYGDEQFAAGGIRARDCKFVVVKNPMNYQQAYEGAAGFFLLDTPGPTTPNLPSIAIPRAGRPLYPFDDGFTPRYPVFRGRRA